MLFSEIFNREEEELLVICDWLLGKRKEAASSKGSAGVPPAVSRILRDTSSIPVGRRGLAAPTLGIKIYRKAAKVAKGRRGERWNVRF